MYRTPNLKRTVDLVISIILVGILFPIFPLIGILIKIWMPGPVFFMQRRIGKDCIPFTIYKFRTMGTIDPIESERFEPGDNSRTTRLGKLLRDTKIDEIPQLINVLKGDMSLVGPRPEIKKWTEIYTDKWRIVHSVRPGITDNASLEFRNEEKILSASGDPEKTYRDLILPRKLDLNIAYTNQQSMMVDMRILFRTAKEILLK